MGGVSHFAESDLKKFKVFVETGTSTGGGADYLSKVCDRGYTIDIVDSWLHKAPNVKFLLGESTKYLPEICTSVEEPIVFWLDAHYASFYGTRGYEELPLVKELEIISTLRPNKADLILIDDLRIYENGPYAGGNLPHGYTKGESNFNDIVTKLFPGRELVREYQEEGYLSIRC